MRIVWDPAAPRTPAARATASCAAAGRAKRLRPADRAVPQAARARRSCRGEVADYAAAAGVTARIGQRRRCRHALGQLLVAGRDPLELAADPRAARRCGATSSRTRSRISSTSTTAPSSRRSRRGSTARASPKRRRRYGASGRGCGGSGGGVDRAAAGGGWRLAAAAAAGGWRLRLLLRREGLVELLLASARRCRRAGPSAAAADSPARGGGVPSGMPFSSTIGAMPLASIALVAVHLFLGRQLPVGHRHLGLELLDRAVGDGDAHEIVERARRARCRPAARRPARASSRPIHTPVVRPLEKPMNQPSLLERGGAGLAGDRAADLRRAAGAGQHRRLQQVGHLGRDPWRDQHALLVAFVLVEHAAVGGDDAADAVGRDRDALVGDRGEGAGHVDQPDVAACPAPSTG